MIVLLGQALSTAPGRMSSMHIAGKGRNWATGVRSRPQVLASVGQQGSSVMAPSTSSDSHVLLPHASPVLASVPPLLLLVVVLLLLVALVLLLVLLLVELCVLLAVDPPVPVLAPVPAATVPPPHAADQDAMETNSAEKRAIPNGLEIMQVTSKEKSAWMVAHLAPSAKFGAAARYEAPADHPSGTSTRIPFAARISAARGTEMASARA